MNETTGDPTRKSAIIRRNPVEAREDPQVNHDTTLDNIEKLLAKSRNPNRKSPATFTRRDVLRVADAMGVDIRKKRTNTESDKLSNPKK